MMLSRNVQDEENVIKLYKQIVNMARRDGGETTNRLFREILQQEEEHHNTFTTVLEDF